AFPPRDRGAFMAHWRGKVLPDPRVVKKGVLFDGRLVGDLVSFEQDGEREVGYWIAREYWGRGIATAALAHTACCELMVCRASTSQPRGARWSRVSRAATSCTPNEPGSTTTASSRSAGRAMPRAWTLSPPESTMQPTRS